MGTYYPERSVFGYTTSKIKADLLGCGGTNLILKPLGFNLSCTLELPGELLNEKKPPKNIFIKKQNTFDLNNLKH